jgi:hypothetical protein
LISFSDASEDIPSKRRSQDNYLRFKSALSLRFANLLVGSQLLTHQVEPRPVLPGGARDRCRDLKLSSHALTSSSTGVQDEGRILSSSCSRIHYTICHVRPRRIPLVHREITRREWTFEFAGNGQKAALGIEHSRSFKSR